MHWFHKDATAEKSLKDLIRHLPPEELKVILDCLADRRINDPAKTRESYMLTETLHLGSPNCATLVKFGFAYYFDCCYFVNVTVAFIRGMIRIEEDKHLQDEDLYADNFFRYVDKNLLMDRGGLRLQMAVELLMAVFVRPHHKEFVSLIWKSQPYPFITSEELYDLLKPAVLHKHDALKNFCEEFKEKNTICPVPKVSQPRSLKHLSRVQVRKSLSEANSLSENTVDGLCIPASLKAYLKLEEF